MQRFYFLATVSCLLSSVSFGQVNLNNPCSITNQTTTAAQAQIPCGGSTSINLASTQVGYQYTLRDNATNEVIAGPIAGTGSAINLPTGGLTQTTTYNVLAEQQTLALAFDGQNDYVNVPSLTNLSGNAITIEYWFKGSSIQSAVRYQNGGSNYVVSGWNNNHILSNDGGSANGLFVGFGVTDGNWHHVAMTWEQNTVNGFKSYLDGVLVAERTSSNSPIPNQTYNLLLGAYQTSAEFMNGSLDQVRVWSVARTAGEIQAGMNQCDTSGQLGLLLYYQFENGAGSSVVTDLSGNNHHGTLNNMDLNANWVYGTVFCASCSSVLIEQPSVTFLPPPSGSENITTCSSYSWLANGVTYTTSGTYTTMVTKLNGCDSIATINLTIEPVLPKTVSATETALCIGNSGTTVTIDSSQTDVNYSLYDAIADTLVDGPTLGTGGTLIFQTGTLNSSMTYNMIGESLLNSSGTSMRFDGVDDYLKDTTGTFPYIDLYSRIEAWVYLESYGTGTTIIEKPDQFHFYIDASGIMHFGFDEWGWTDEYDSLGTPVPLHQWVNIGVQNDAIFSFYINGNYVGSSNAVYPLQYTPTFGNTTIGGTNSGSGVGGTVDGRIDALAVGYPSLEDLSCIDPLNTNLLAYYDFEEGNGNIVVNRVIGATDTLVLTEMNNATAWQVGVSCGTCMVNMANQVTINVSVPTAGSESIIACSNYTWSANATTYMASGSYTASLTNVGGCDSTATLNLTVNTVDAGVTSSGLTVTADLSGASYQWIDCGNGNTPIPGATNQSYTATMNGDYAVIVATNNCSDTSVCMTINEAGLAESEVETFQMYPNPTRDIITLDFGSLSNVKTVELKDGSGRILKTISISDKQVKMDLSDYVSGVYFVVVSLTNGEQVQRIMKQ